MQHVNYPPKNENNFWMKNEIDKSKKSGFIQMFNLFSLFFYKFSVNINFCLNKYFYNLND